MLLQMIDSDYADKEFAARSELAYVVASCYKRVDEYPKGKFAVRACYRIAMVYMRVKKDYEKAVYWFGQQRERYDYKRLSERALAKMGGIYRAELKDYGRAVDCFEQYEREYPDGPTLWG